jgi:polyisoprenoid-binding protein YceI
MNSAPIRRLAVCACVLLAMCALSELHGGHRILAKAAGAQSGDRELILTLDPAQSKVHWSLGSTVHNVHGTFAVKRGTVRLNLDNGKANGEIVVDAASGESGNGMRDKKMRNEILETPRFAEIVFRPDRFEGTVPAPGIATVLIHGTFLLHGSEHELTVQVQTEYKADHWKGTTKFPVPFVDWGLKNPSNFVLRTDAYVDVDLQLAGVMRSGKTP